MYSSARILYKQYLDNGLSVISERESNDQGGKALRGRVIDWGMFNEYVILIFERAYNHSIDSHVVGKLAQSLPCLFIFLENASQRLAEEAYARGQTPR